jgi:1-acyl-sn-glycerol-3-phosphate acyltransferase
MNGILSLYMWGEIAVVAIGGFFVQLPVTLVTWPFDRNRTLGGRMLRLTGVVAAKLSPYWEFKIHGAYPKTLKGRFVCVSNHESNADPFLVSLLPWEMKWVFKKSLLKVPFAGWGMWLSGDVPVERGAEGEAQRVIAKCAEYVQRGMPVMLCPEGTRSKDGTLLPFKDGAFRLAIETKAQVLPIAVSGTRRALPKHSWKFGKTKGLVKVGEPISTEGMTLADVEKLKQLAREQIIKMRAELEPLTAVAES